MKLITLPHRKQTKQKEPNIFQLHTIITSKTLEKLSLIAAGF